MTSSSIRQIIVIAIAAGCVLGQSAGTFTATGSMTTARAGHTATLLADGRVLIAGDTADGSAPPGDGRGQGAIWHADTGQIASADNPASSGEVLSMYTRSLIKCGVIPPQVAVVGQAEAVPYFGDAPEYPGYSQVNFRVPAGVASAPNVSVRLTYLNRPSNEVTIAVQCTGGFT